MVAAAAGPTLCLLPPPSCDEPREPLYYNFPLSEKFQMATEAPLWDSDWDGREKAYKALRGKVPGVTRHVILVRHGQYDEVSQASHPPTRQPANPPTPPDPPSPPPSPRSRPRSRRRTRPTRSAS
jgi:hypothetical protein